VDDPNAKTKLHAPIGVIRDDAIKPAGRDPGPEEVAMKKPREEEDAGVTRKAILELLRLNLRQAGGLALIIDQFVRAGDFRG